MTAKKAILFSMPPSTDVELTRWVLDHFEIPFSEHRHAPIFHLIPSYRYHLSGNDYPILVDGAVLLAVSRGICDYYETRCSPQLKLYPTEPAELSRLWQLWDEIHDPLGFAARTWIYYYVLPYKKKVFHALTAGCPLWERLIVSTFFPIYWRLMWRGMEKERQAMEDSGGSPVALHGAKSTEAAADARKDLATTDRVFNAVEKMLADGREYLLGNRFGFADMVFATMAVPVILPAEYGGALPEFDRLEPHVQQVVEEYRRRPAGQFALRMFRDHRKRK